MGNIVVFEGVDGCGKSSIVAKTAEMLQAKGYRVKTAREIGGTPIGEKIRELILFPEQGCELSATAETLMIYAARERLLSEMRAHPDTLYLLDRHFISTHIYQGTNPEALELSLLLANKICNNYDYIHTFLVERSGAGKGVVPDAMEEKYVSDSDMMIQKYRGFATLLKTEWSVLTNNDSLEHACLSVIDHLMWHTDTDMSVYK